jgi:hypothetical protein
VYCAILFLRSSISVERASNFALRTLSSVASFREGWAIEEKVERTRTSGLVNLNALVEKISREVCKVLL